MLWLRRAVLRVALVAAVCSFVLAASSSAFADQCDEATLASLEPEWTLNDSECFVVDDADPNAVPVCLLEGASAIADRIVHAPSDARIEAAKRCTSFLDPDELSSPHDDGPQRQLPSSFLATLTPMPAMPSVDTLRVIDALHETQLARLGHRAAVYRPPQA